MRKQLGKKNYYYFVNIGLKIALKMPVLNTQFEQYVKYEGPVLERKELCDEMAFSSLKSNRSPWYDGISSNVINSVSEEIFFVLKHVLNLSMNQGVFPENMKIACVTPIFKIGDKYLIIIGLSQYCHVSQKP